MSIKDAIKLALQKLSGDSSQVLTSLEEAKLELANAVDQGTGENIFTDTLELGQKEMQETLHSLFDDSGKDIEGNKGKSIYNTGEFQVLNAPAVYQDVEIDEQAYTDERGKVLGNTTFAEQVKFAAPDYNPETMLAKSARRTAFPRANFPVVKSTNLAEVKSVQNESQDHEVKVAETKGNPDGIVRSVVQKTSYTRTITQVQRVDGQLEQQIEDKSISEDVETLALANGNLQTTTNISTNTKVTVYSNKEQPRALPAETKREESFADLFEGSDFALPSPQAKEEPQARLGSSKNKAFKDEDKVALKQLMQDLKEEESFASLLDSYSEPRQEQGSGKKHKFFAPNSYANKVANKSFDLDADEEEIAFNLDEVNQSNKQFNREVKFAQMFEQKEPVKESNYIDIDDSFRKAFQDIKPLKGNNSNHASLEQQRRQAEHERRLKAGLKSGKEFVEQQVAQQDYARLSSQDNVIFSDINMRFNEFNYENARFMVEGLDTEVSHVFFNGMLPIDREVDLHGYTSEDLKAIIPAVVKDCWRNNEYTIRFITGHGKDILKQNLPNYLVQYERVAAFYPNKENNGRGRTNGFIVLLRNYDKEVAANYSFKSK
ncbi:hypothetical protein CKF54_04305 [Psittacicella hinzii]|uniref:Smr domain-containing protein n=1 Tax=Psittacicella hinzii TaxID=2028575 RepID=A0A3A1Y970_9GAMM|nr:Smr/MutS family protein [Psittacicella hinzii]RIY32684.1 hypothetical protein CKF54_04305 [Psittacicella hinzii]